MSVVTDAPREAAWKERFRVPVVRYTSLARRAKTRGVAVSNRSGCFQLYAWDVPSARLTQLTDDPAGVGIGTISPDGRHVYHVEDRGGNEIGHWVRIPFEGGAAEDLTPDLPPYSCWSQDFSQDNQLMGFVAADRHGFTLYLIDLAAPDLGAARRALYHTDKLIFGPELSYGGEIAVMATIERTGKPEFSLVAFRVADGTRLAELYDAGASIEPVAFGPLPHDSRLLARTNRSGFNRPLIWNPQTGERIDVELSDLDGDVAPVDWSPDGKRLLLCQINQAVQQLWLYNLERGTAQRLEEAPAGTYGVFGEGAGYFGPEGEIFAPWQDSVHPAQVIALDPATGEQTRTVLPAGEAPASHRWRSVTFPSSNGATIQGWLAVPVGAGPGPFPTVLETHGGPEAVMTEVFAPRAQLWPDLGFAYLTINYHGSTTFGREFQESIWGHPGELEVEDMVAAREWLIAQGIARPDLVFLTGWSYGGYLTLQGIGTTPDLWAGGMAGVAVADWSIDYQDAAETLKGYDVAFFGGTPEEKPEAYHRASPIAYVENVRAPVVIIQGRNDTRCPPRQVEVYAAKMRELSKPIEVVWFDAGHGSLNIAITIQHAQIMSAFAQQIVDRVKS